MELPAHWAEITVSHKRMRQGGAGDGAGGGARKRSKEADEQDADAGAADSHQDLLAAGAKDCMDVAVLNREATKNTIMDELKNRTLQSTIGHRLQEIENTNRATITGLVNNVTHNLIGLVSLSRYSDILQDMQEDKMHVSSELKSVSKAFEDGFLRQPIHEHERPCARGENCECMFLDPNISFVGVEYVLPWEKRTSKKKAGGFCLPCIRATTLALYMDILHSGNKTDMLIQRYYNEHSRPGEYKLSSMLIAPPNGPVSNMPLPILRHQRSNYYVYKEHGITYAQQVNVDFR